MYDGVAVVMLKTLLYQGTLVYQLCNFQVSENLWKSFEKAFVFIIRETHPMIDGQVDHAYQVVEILYEVAVDQVG